MKGTDLLLLILICIVVVFGALYIIDKPIDQKEDKKVSCSYPYISFNEDCCIDLNHNSVCDYLEPKKIDTTDYDKVITDLKADLRECKIEAERQKSIAYEYQRRYDSCERDDRKYRDIDITILVKDDDTGRDIEDAYIRIWDGDSDSKYTDDEGEAEFSLEDDCYDIKIIKDNYYEYRDDFCLDEDDDGDTIQVYLRRE